MQEFSYHGFQRFRVIASQITGVLAILIFTGLAGFLSYGMTEMPVSKPGTGWLEDPKVTLVCLIFYFLILSWGIGLTFINYLPTVWVSNEGLTISAFFFFRILIRWEDIIDVDAGRMPAGYILVRARRITLLHRIYGWMHSFRLYPSFIIGPGIENHEKLVRKIRGKAWMNAS